MSIAIDKQQANYLNTLANVSSDLRKAALGLKERATRIAESVEKGHHIEGFDSDVLGQVGRETQHYASQRAALLKVGHNVPEEALMIALTETGKVNGHYFREGQTFEAKVGE